AVLGRCLLAEDISNNVGRWKTIVCRWHDPGGIQGDGKHSHLERRHHRALRARRRSPNRKSINIRAGWPRLLILREIGERPVCPQFLPPFENRERWGSLSREDVCGKRECLGGPAPLKIRLSGERAFRVAGSG